MSPDPPDKQTTEQMHGDLVVSNICFRCIPALAELQSSERLSHFKLLWLFLLSASPHIQLHLLTLKKLNSLDP